MILSEDGYLLQKVVNASTLKRMIDWKQFNITQKNLDDMSKADLQKTLKYPDINNELDMDKHYVMLLCLPYNPPPDDRDVFVYYNDIRALSGTAGYLRVRDGFVYGQRAAWRS